MPDNDPDDPEANDTLTTDTEVMSTPTDAVEAPLEPELATELEADLATDTDTDPESEPESELAEADGEASDYEEEFIPPSERPGDWYVVHTYAGYENKVKANLETRIASLNMEDFIFQIEVPTQDEMVIKQGKRQTVQSKIFPGYVLVRMDLTDESWSAVKNTPSVTGSDVGWPCTTMPSESPTSTASTPASSVSRADV